MQFRKQSLHVTFNACWDLRGRKVKTCWCNVKKGRHAMQDCIQQSDMLAPQVLHVIPLVVCNLLLFWFFSLVCVRNVNSHFCFSSLRFLNSRGQVNLCPTQFCRGLLKARVYKFSKAISATGVAKTMVIKFGFKGHARDTARRPWIVLWLYTCQLC